MGRPFDALRQHEAAVARVMAIAAVLVGTRALTFLLAPVFAQGSQSSDVLEEYDANDEGVISETELRQAALDYLDGDIDRAQSVGPATTKACTWPARRS